MEGLNIASHGRGSTSVPSRRVNPSGVFIQAFAATTKNAPADPERIIGTAVSMCALADSRSHPKR